MAQTGFTLNLLSHSIEKAHYFMSYKNNKNRRIELAVCSTALNVTKYVQQYSYSPSIINTARVPSHPTWKISLPEVAHLTHTDSKTYHPVDTYTTLV